MSVRFFGSDNNATVHPAVMEALNEANRGHAKAYGEDEWTQSADRVFKEIFGPTAEVFFVYNGTGANVIGMQSALSSYHGVICTEVSHINYDECGAAENFIGSKLLTIGTADGRITADRILPFLSVRGVVHHAQPKVVSLTQATEFGTVYESDSVRAIAKICHENDMYLHMDGARLSNAAASLGSELGEITGELGVDILSLGGTKNGVMFGEAIVVWKPELAEKLHYIRKQGMQLASKMRFISAQFTTLFGTDLWRENALHANGLATELAARLRSISGVEIVHPVEANGIFARLPRPALTRIQEEFFFYEWDPDENTVRLMLSFDSTMEDVEEFVALVRKHLS